MKIFCILLSKSVPFPRTGLGRFGRPRRHFHLPVYSPIVPLACLGPFSHGRVCGSHVTEVVTASIRASSCFIYVPVPTTHVLIVSVFEAGCSLVAGVHSQSDAAGTCRQTPIRLALLSTSSHLVLLFPCTQEFPMRSGTFSCDDRVGDHCRYIAGVTAPRMRALFHQ